MKPVVSICIANYNGIPIISECLDSIYAQQGDIPVEIIVHDDASTDGSVEFLRRNYPNIRLIESKHNVGFCVSNNRMATVAKGEYLLLLNNDAALFPDAIVSLLAKAKEISRPAILGLPQYDADNGELLDRGSLFDPFLNPIPNLDSSRLDVGMVMGACMWIPKELWLELGGFPEWFGSIGEDLYLCCRARLAGYKVAALGHSGFHHRVGHSFGGGKVTKNGLATSKIRRSLSERNKNYAMLLIYPWPSLLLVLPCHLIFLLIEGLLLAAYKCDWQLFRSIYLASLRAIWHQRTTLCKLRQSIQRQRRASILEFFSVFQLFPYKLAMFVQHGFPVIKH